MRKVTRDKHWGGGQSAEEYPMNKCGTLTEGPEGSIEGGASGLAAGTHENEGMIKPGTTSRLLFSLAADVN
jgi:hypothetical protein